MIKYLKISYLALIFIVFSPLTSGQILRTLDGLKVSTKSSQKIDIKQMLSTNLMAPTNRWILIILNKNLNNSQQMLKYLHNQTLNLDKTVIAVIANEEKTEVFPQYRDKLDVYQWLELKNSQLLKQLKLQATPVVLGMQGTQVRWKISGVSTAKTFESNIAHINKWSMPSSRDIKP